MTHRGLQHLWVAGIYGACYELMREISVANWNLPTGLRVLCLLLVPYRFWPAMAVGEGIALIHHGWAHLDEFGWLWTATIMVPPLLAIAPPIAFARRFLPLVRSGEPHVAAMLVYILIGGTVNALVNTATLSTVHMPPGETAPAITMHIVLTYFLGSYLGALTLVPAILAFWRPDAGWSRLAINRAFLRDCAIGVVPPLLLLVLLEIYSDNAELVEIGRMAAFLPAAWMTLRHGWRGAAIAGLLASFAVELTVTANRDPAVIQAQALVAFAVSSLLMLGSRLPHAVKEVRSDMRSAGESLRGFQLAQQGLYQEELRLRHVADSLDRLGESMLVGQKRMMDRLGPQLSSNIDHAYTRHLDLTQREMKRLADALHPRSWRERGLVATFEDGPLAQAAAMAGAEYRCEFSGAGLSLLAPDVHMMLYRQACEVLVYLLAREPVRSVRMQIRGGCTHGRRWVVLRMTASRATASQRGRPAPEWRQLVSLLGTNGQGIATVRERALIYGGLVHEHEDENRLGVTLLLHDALRIEAAEAGLLYARPAST
ncbi:MASE1 domain-containing protein [Dyella jiangningensis]|uniref:MASE1 domain-containing protein n=1 Tax=Dyella jiangningensis TaxID=1379159 RepID=UPI0024106C48|nr:MASE1 domain-containing protein [Dyella jiangningensis]MDG2536063.1 MASE1 domain-containing protein [Dyella jiangningensis]